MWSETTMNGLELVGLFAVSASGSLFAANGDLVEQAYVLLILSIVCALVAVIRRDQRPGTGGQVGGDDPPIPPDGPAGRQECQCHCPSCVAKRRRRSKRRAPDRVSGD